MGVHIAGLATLPVLVLTEEELLVVHLLVVLQLRDDLCGEQIPLVAPTTGLVRVS